MAWKRRREILNQKDFSSVSPSPANCRKPDRSDTQIQSRAQEVCASVAEVEVVARRKTQEKKKSPRRLLEPSWGEIRRQLYWSRLVWDAVNRLQSLTPPSTRDSRDRLHLPPQDTGSFISLLTTLRHVKKEDNSVQKPANELSQQQISIDEAMGVILWGRAFMWLTSELFGSGGRAVWWMLPAEIESYFFPSQPGGTCGKARNHRPSKK